MSNLSNLIKSRRQSGQGVLQSLGGSLKDRLKEKIDPRRIFKQDGILTALFPGLKSYDASSKKFGSENIQSSKSIQIIELNTSIAAKNSSALTEIARDANLSSKNLLKFVKMIGKETPAKKADMFFQNQKQSEKDYENKMQKVTKVQKTEKKKSFGLMDLLLNIGLVGGSFLLFDFLTKGPESIVSNLYDSLKDLASEGIDKLKTYIKDNIILVFKNKFDEVLLKTETYFNGLYDNLKENLSADGLKLLLNIEKEEDLTKGLTDKLKEKTDLYKKEIGQSFEGLFPEVKAMPAPPPSQTMESKVSPKTSFSPTQQSSGGIKGLLEQIAKGEGTTDQQAQQRGLGSGYDVVYGYGQYVKPQKPISKMTVAEVKQFQKKQIAATKGKIPRTSKGTGAVGKYQITETTLQGLQNQLGFPDSQVFSPEFQDMLAIKLIEGRGLKKFQAGTMKARDFQNALAKEWASIGTFETGKSAYGQATGTSTSEIQRSISGVRNADQAQKISSLSGEITVNDGMSNIKTKTVVAMVEKNNTTTIQQKNYGGSNVDVTKMMLTGVA